MMFFRKTAKTGDRAQMLFSRRRLHVEITRGMQIAACETRAGCSGNIPGLKCLM